MAELASLRGLTLTEYATKMPDRGVSSSPSPRWRRGSVRPRAATASPEARWRQDVYEGERTFTMDEVEGHFSSEDPWVVVAGGVYAVGQLAQVHPGGCEAILRYAGTDATSGYIAARHPRHAQDALSQYRLGRVHALRKDTNAMHSFSPLLVLLLCTVVSLASLAKSCVDVPMAPA